MFLSIPSSGPGMPVRQFLDESDIAHFEKTEEMAQYRKGTLLYAAQNVARRYHDMKHACWECGSVPDDGNELKYCSECEAAGYCSRECQVRLLSQATPLPTARDVDSPTRNCAGGCLERRA